MIVVITHQVEVLHTSYIIICRYSKACYSTCIYEVGRGGMRLMPFSYEDWCMVFVYSFYDYLTWFMTNDALFFEKLRKMTWNSTKYFFGKIRKYYCSFYKSDNQNHYRGMEHEIGFVFVVHFLPK